MNGVHPGHLQFLVLLATYDIPGFMVAAGVA